MPRRYPTQYQQRTLWNAATGLSIVFLGALFVGFVWLSGQIFGYLQPVLVPLAISGIVAYLLEPLVNWMQKKGLSRLRSVIAVFCGFVVAFCLAALLVVPPITKQAGQLISDREELGERLTTKFEEVKEWPVFASVVKWSSTKVDEEGKKLKQPTPYYGNNGILIEDDEPILVAPTNDEKIAAEKYRDADTKLTNTINTHLGQIFKADRQHLPRWHFTHLQHPRLHDRLRDDPDLPLLLPQGKLRHQSPMAQLRPSPRLEIQR